jgi:tetratricopeptide (TPR) repeat protein
MGPSLHELRRQVAVAPTDGNARLALAEWLAVERDFNGASEQASAAIACDSGLLRAHELLVQAYLEEARGAKASEALQEAVLRFPKEMRIQALLGKLRLAEGHLSEALLAFDTGVEFGREAASHGGSPRACAELGLEAAQLGYRLGLPILAQRHLAISHALCTDPSLRNRIQELREEWGEPSSHHRVAKLSSPERLLSDAQQRLAVMLAVPELSSVLQPTYRALRTRNFDNLKKELITTSAGTNDPRVALALNQLRVDVCIAEGNLEDARRILSRRVAQAEEPFSGAASEWSQFQAERLGALAERDGHLEEARRIYATATEAHPNSHDFLEALGDLSKALGDLGAATTAWRRAAALEPAGAAAVKYFASLSTRSAHDGRTMDASQRWSASTAFRMFALATAGGVAGSMTLVEAVAFDGPVGLVFTGQVGTVGQEAARAAHACLRAKAARLGIARAVESSTLHLHFADAHISKDGPSAGLSLALLGLAALSGNPLSPDLAATGAITLGGVVEGVGGVGDKLIAALLAGAKTVLVPRDNLFDVRGLPERVRREVRIVPVASLEEALPVAFSGGLNATSPHRVSPTEEP